MKSTQALHLLALSQEQHVIKQHSRANMISMWPVVIMTTALRRGNGAIAKAITPLIQCWRIIKRGFTTLNRLLAQILAD
jgi:hypothetical protein